MLHIKMNRDITSKEYDMGLYKGLSGREIGYGAATLLIGGIIIYLLSQIMLLIFAVYLAAPICFAIGFMGFYHKNGMTFGQLLKKRREYSNEKPFIRSSSQILKEIFKFKEPVQQEEKKKYGFKGNKKGK